MAISILQSASATASPGTSAVATLSSSATTGSMALLLVASYQQDPGTGHVTDNKGNTYTRIFHPNNGNIYIAQYAAYNVTGGASFATTYNPTTSHPYTIVLVEVAITGGGAIDVSATNTGNATPAFAMLSGTTGATADAEEILFACFSHTGGTQRTVTGRTAGYTNLYERDTVGAWDGFAPPFNVDYRVTSSTSTQAETINWENGDNAYVGGIAAYKAVGGGSNALAGTVAGTSTVVGALIQAQPIAGTTAGASTVVGALTVTKPLEGSTAGASTVVGALTQTQPVAGISAGASVVSGALSQTHALSGTSDGAATVAGTLTQAQPLAGTVDGVGTASGALSQTHGLAGALAGTSTVVGALSIAGFIDLAGTVAGSSTLLGAITQTHALAGSAAGTSSMAGILTGSAVNGYALVSSSEVWWASVADEALYGVAVISSAVGYATVGDE